MTLEVAANCFKNADYYHKVRIEFSESSARLALQHLNILRNGGFSEVAIKNDKDGPFTVLELAAGTGKLTTALLKTLRNTNVRFIASEPTKTMADVFEKNYPEVEFLRCRSEKIPLPESSVHAIVAGNAAHYLCSPESLSEMHRVLAPGGGVGFVRLDIDPDAASWCKEILNMERKCYLNKGVVNVVDGWHGLINQSGYFHVAREDSSHRFSVSLSEDDVLDYIMSYGAFQESEEEQQLKRRDEVQNVLRKNFSGVGKVLTEIPMQAIVFCAKIKK